MLPAMLNAASPGSGGTRVNAMLVASALREPSTQHTVFQYLRCCLWNLMSHDLDQADI